MKHLSTDIESFDLFPHPNNIISLAFVAADSGLDTPHDDLPRLHILFGQSPHSTSDVALTMNAWLFAARALCKGTSESYLRQIACQESIDRAKAAQFTHYIEGGVDSPEAKEIITSFIRLHFGEKRATLSGKNVCAFDLQFFPDWLKSMFGHRALEPGSMLVRAGDEKIPDQAECCRRVGLSSVVSHDALGDALQVVDIVYRVLNSQNKDLHEPQNGEKDSGSL